MKFIQFGCWNKSFCDQYFNDLSDSGIYSPMTHVMYNINNLVNREEFDFLIISGDNYYPTSLKKTLNSKELKFKLFNYKNFYSGFACLNNINIRKYLLFGNHEINDEVISENYSNLPTDEILKLKSFKCISLIAQQDIPKNLDNNLIIFNSVLHEYDESEKTLLIMIDTTIYEKVKNPECYKIIFNNQNIDIETIKKIQLDSIINILNNFENSETVIFSGHHPIISCKNKNGDKFTKLNELVNLFINLENNLIPKKIIYLCADTHMYQKGNVEISTLSGKILNIEQHIVGTGGADLDSTCIGNDIEIKKEQEMVITEDININYSKINYNIQVQSRSYGFLIYNQGVTIFNSINNSKKEFKIKYN